MAIHDEEFSDGQVLTGDNLEAFRANINAHNHDGTSGIQLVLNQAVTSASRQAQYLSTGRSGSGGGTGRGSTVQAHIDTVGSAGSSDSNPHGLAMDYIGDYAGADSTKNNALIWIDANRIIWLDSSANPANDNLGVPGDPGTIGFNGQEMVLPNADTSVGYFMFPFYHSQAGTYIRVSIVWYSGYAGAGDVVFGTGIGPFGTGAFDFTTDSNATTQYGTWTATNNYVLQTCAHGGTDAINVSRWSFNPSTLTYPISDEDLVSVRVYRFGINASDTLPYSISIFGIMISYWLDHPLAV